MLHLIGVDLIIESCHYEVEIIDFKPYHFLFLRIKKAYALSYYHMPYVDLKKKKKLITKFLYYLKMSATKMVVQLTVSIFWIPTLCWLLNSTLLLNIISTYDYPSKLEIWFFSRLKTRDYVCITVLTQITISCIQWQFNHILPNGFTSV